MSVRKNYYPSDAPNKNGFEDAILMGMDPEFKETFSLKLEPGETASYLTSAWIWQPITDSVRFIPPRYTEAQNIKLCNDTQHVIDIRVGVPNDEDVEFQIQPGRTHEFKVSACVPGEKVILHFDSWKLAD